MRRKLFADAAPMVLLCALAQALTACGASQPPGHGSLVPPELSGGVESVAPAPVIVEQLFESPEDAGNLDAPAGEAATPSEPAPLAPAD
jgi:hypothetical protein